VDFKIVWTALARDDLREIVTYIARDNPVAARRVGQKVLDSVEVLMTMPRVGRIVPELSDPKLREIIRGNYRIVYRIRDEPRLIEVWRVWHGARGAPRLTSPGQTDNGLSSC
jgi:toxin ParE1/3/4